MTALWKPTLVTNPIEIAEVYSFLNQTGFALEYPSYSSWLEEARNELLGGRKQASVVRDLEGRVVATVVFQEDKHDSRRVEMKNRRVAMHMVRRGLGQSLAYAVETYAKEHGYSAVIADTHETNVAAIGSLRKAGFEEEARQPLYDPKINEVIMLKRL